MKKVEFETLTIQNFLSFGKKTTIDFKNGINVITGWNLDKNDGNGVGKSSVIDAFYYSIFGETLKDLNKEDIVNDQINKNCEVSLKFNINDNGTITNYKIERGIAPSFCKLYVNESEIKTLSTIPATNAYIFNLITTSQSVFKKTIAMALNNSQPFMALKKTEKREFVEGVFKLEIIKHMNKMAKDNYDAIFKEYDFSVKTYTEYENNIKSYTDKRDILETNRINTLNTLNARLLEYLKGNKELETSIIDIDMNLYNDIDVKLKNYTDTETQTRILFNNTNKLLASNESNLNRNNTQITTINNNIKSSVEAFKKFPVFGEPLKTIDEFKKLCLDLEKNIATYKLDILQLKQDINNNIKEIQKIKSVGAFCDKCKRPYDNNDIKSNELKINELLTENSNKETQCISLDQNAKQTEEHLAKSKLMIDILNYKDQIALLSNENKTLESNIIINNEDLKKHEATLNTIKSEVETLKSTQTEIKLKIEKNNSIKKLINSNNISIKNINDDIFKKTNEKNQFDDLIIDLENKKQILAKNIEDYKESIAIYDVIKFVLSDEGAKTYIIKKMLDTLNERIKYYLTKMEANCTLTFNEYFEDKIINDRGIQKSYHNFSEGEKKRIDLACLFSFMDIRRIQGTVSFNLAFYDELLDSALSSNGTQKVFEILQERVNMGENAYIITHKKENIKNPLINNIIYFEKLGGVTRLGECKQV